MSCLRTPFPPFTCQAVSAAGPDTTAARRAALAAPDRVAALQGCEGVTPGRGAAEPDDALAALVRRAAAAVGAPVALASRVDVERDHWLAAVGVPAVVAAAGDAARPTFCEEVVVTGTPVVVGDALEDPHFAAFPAVAAHGVRACLAVPLAVGGQVIGSLCALDVRPRAWTADDLLALEDLAGAAAAVLERDAARGAFRDLLGGGLDGTYLLRSVRDAGGRVADFTVVDCNARAAALVGRPRDALVGRSWHALFATPRARAMFAQYVRVAQTGRPYEVEFAVTDGAVRAEWLRVQAVRVGDGVAVTAQDITARKGTEAALREGEARFRALIEHAQDVTGVIAADGTIQYQSPAITRVLGVSADELVGRAAFDFIHPDDAPGLAVQFAELLAAPGARVRVRYRCRHADGEYRLLEGEAWNLVGHPAVGGVVVNVRDVTDRERDAAALRESEARLRLALEAANDGLWDWHIPSGAVYYSPRWTAMLGYAEGDVPARFDALRELLHPEDAPRVAAALDAALAAPRPAAADGAPADGAPDFSLEYRLRAADGSWRWVLGRGDVVERDLAGAAVRMAGTHVDVHDRKTLEAALVQQATHDALTGLANRDHFRARVDAALAGAALADAARAGGCERGERGVVVLFLDLDDFKAVNDALGHAAGDALLRAAAGRLLHATRGCDTVARLGGDEFAVLLDGAACDAEGRVVADRIARTLERPFAVGGREVCTRGSVGIARAAAGDDADALLRNADLAMYRAKAGGKGRVAVFAPAMHQALIDRVALADDLRRVADWQCEGAPDLGAREAAGEFSLVYQPIVGLGDGRVGGAEALFRWRHPSRGPVSPAECIPLAEETGLIVPIGRWVLEAACREATRWAGGGFVTVNVSARQLQQPAFVDDVTDVLAATGLAAGRLVLEITEGVLMQRTDETLARLHALKALGVRLAVDDFGTGYSSLAYLQRFPLDVLKLDKAFVDPLAQGGPHAALARTVLALGEALGLRTVAEGVETAEQRAELVGLGCGWGQGYLFSRPLAAEAMRERAAAA